MKRIMAFAGVMCVMLALISSGCSKKENAESKKISITRLSDRKNEYLTSLKNFSTKNISASDDLVLTFPKKVYSGKYICTSGYQRNARKLFSHYVSDYSQKNETLNENTYPTGPDYLDPETGLEMSIGCNGFFSYNTEDFDTKKYFPQNNNKLIKTYSYNELDSDDHYTLKGGKDISVSEARRLAQEFADDFVGMADFGNGLRVSRINLYKTGQEYYYQIDYSQSVNGMDILNYTPKYVGSDIVAPMSIAFLVSDRVADFAVNSLIEPYKTKEVKRITDPEDATERVSRRLAKNMSLRLKRVSLEYCLKRIGNLQESKDGEETDREIAGYSTFYQADLYEVTPCWILSVIQGSKRLCQLGWRRGICLYSADIIPYHQMP